MAAERGVPVEACPYRSWKLGDAWLCGWWTCGPETIEEVRR